MWKAGEAIAPDSGSWKNKIRVGRPHLDGVHHLDQVYAIPLGKKAPFIHKSQDGGTKGIFHNLAGFALERTVENSQRKFVNVEHVR